MGTIIALIVTAIAVCVAGVSWYIGSKAEIVQYVATYVALGGIAYISMPEQLAWIAVGVVAALAITVFFALGPLGKPTPVLDPSEWMEEYDDVEAQ